MRQYITKLTAILAILLPTMTSCDKDTEGMTYITYYPIITLEGELYSTAPAGTPYVDPGYTATLDGEDFTSQVVMTSDMDLDNPTPGYYTVRYTAASEYGSAAAVRYVLVSSGVDVAAGYYTVQPTSYRLNNGATEYYGVYPSITIVGDGNGNYHIDDLLGGWYTQRMGYAAKYAMGGNVHIDNDGTMTLIDSYIPGWKNSATALTDGSYDISTGTITWNVEYSATPLYFIVIATKK